MTASLDAPRNSCYALFNNRHFAPVVVAAHRATQGRADAAVTVRELAAALKVADSVVRPVVLRLVDAGLLADEAGNLDPSRGRGRRQFAILDPPLWTALMVVIEEAGLRAAASDDPA